MRTIEDRVCFQHALMEEASMVCVPGGLEIVTAKDRKQWTVSIIPWWYPYTGVFLYN